MSEFCVTWSLVAFSKVLQALYRRITLASLLCSLLMLVSILSSKTVKSSVFFEKIVSQSSVAVAPSAPKKWVYIYRHWPQQN